MIKNIDTNISGVCTPAPGEAGRTGEWRDVRPVIDSTKCIPEVKGKPACFLCWLYCPDGVVSMTIPVTIDMEYCKGCGICAEECPPNAIKMVREVDIDE
ncbi:MAG TPA: 4Fe-4S binding protein [Syntrophales bacterium]|nr:4Fe-4S binding protein [Syntrophales bacterium]